MSDAGANRNPNAEAFERADLGLPTLDWNRRRWSWRPGRRRRRLFRRQVVFNHAIVDSVEATNRSIADLVAMVETQRVGLAEAVSRQAGALGDAVERQRLAIAAAETRVSAELDELRSQVRRVHQDALDAQDETAAIAAEARATHASTLDLEAQIGVVEQRLQELRGDVEGMVRADQAKQALVDLFLREVQRAYPAKPKRKRLAKLPAGADALYEAMEDAFRGSPETVADRQRPYLRDLGRLPDGATVLDLGSGRGEWLQMLVDAGFRGRGVDRNELAVQRCRAAGLDVAHNDVLRFLAKVPDRSVAAVTAFHLVEHLPFGEVLTLLDHAVRVLQPGGILLLETPNPTNLMVNSSTFLLDPTNERPLHPDLIQFLLGSRGFEEVEVRYLHPAGDALEAGGPSEAAKTIEPVLERLNGLLFGAQDYAMVARRPLR